MTNRFHINLNRMALFIVLIVTVVVAWRGDFLRLALTNIWLNGVIIGTTIFGAGLAFTDMFRLVPEYGWLRRFFGGKAGPNDLPPFLLRPVAIMMTRVQLRKIPPISSQTLTNFMDMIQSRFEDQRESVRYITNTLIFMGLLGTFWGLIHTVGGFATLVGSLDFTDENVMETVKAGLATPLAGIGTAFSASLFGLAGSLIVGFLGLQVQMAQNAIFRELEENLSERTGIA
ncbi:MAG: MotA/TolQ/ExbB proton channel family protein [Proteobacteria bacterium]|nr:MotA/TolQ/ExbB proton channel family protein [Pseudomonadota bacterium]